jgi:tRNA G10  N-methylase Trm11
MKYFFLLGRNPELSVAEVLSYFESHGNAIEDFEVINNGMLFEVKKEFMGSANDFGGVIAMGKVLAYGNPDEIVSKLDEIMLYEGTENKFNYVVYDYGEEEVVDVVRDYLKDRFREEKIKASEKNLSGSMTLQSGEKVATLESPLVSEQFFVFSDSKEIDYFGKIIGSYDSQSQERRDMDKPVRRPELAIPPKIAKIMINLSGIKNGGRLLDPFCGIGVILSESLIMGLSIIGIDRDEKAIGGARENLIWGKFDNNKFKLIKGDSRRYGLNESVDVIVSEPDLGDLLTKTPTEKRAQETMRNFENLMIDMIRNFKKNINGRVVFSAPYIRLHTKKRVGCDGEKIALETGLRLNENFPISDYRKDQIVGREIFVLEN